MTSLRALFTVLTLLLVTYATPVSAATATSFSIESVGSSVGLGNADLQQTTLNILQLVLGLMALVAVAMIIFSVIIAATSSDSERAERAKKTITGAVIGLIVVLLSWAIILFVARTTANVTSGT
jgi:hypothetical protein